MLTARALLVASLLPLLLPLLAGACAGDEPASARYCRDLLTGGAPPADLAALRALLSSVRDNLYPELSGVGVELEAMQSDKDFFVANLDLTTLQDPALQRRYLVRYNDKLFTDPPGHAAAAGILAHELKHIVDYTKMDANALAKFALWYAGASDVSAYERETDEHVLTLGCGEALKRFRIWLYAHVDAPTAAQKKQDYYTPEEIDAWVRAQGG